MKELIEASKWTKIIHLHKINIRNGFCSNFIIIFPFEEDDKNMLITMLPLAGRLYGEAKRCN